MSELQILSNDGVHNLHVVSWEPAGEVKAILQISHGMVEYIERYDGFAKYLNTLGILVVGNDHLGHGHSVNNDDELGYMAPKHDSGVIVNDLHKVTLYFKEKYPNVPYFLFGHSMGSFMARRYIMTYGSELTGAIICGTGSQPGAVLTTAKLVAKTIKLFHGEKYRSEFLKGLSFNGYNSRIKPLRTPNDWLSREESNVDKYNLDKYCTYTFTLNGYLTLFDVITFIQKKENVDRIPKDLPIFMVAGEEDPVGGFGVAVKAIYEEYKAKGQKDISLKLYPEDRHEILNEIDKETVYQDLGNWLKDRI